MTLFYCQIDSPVSQFLIAGNDDSLHYTAFSTGPAPLQPKSDWCLDPAAMRAAREQFAAYFAGELTEFDLHYTLSGTAFQEKVWTALTRIPFGETASYGDVARDIGQPGASRAVGAANNANHLPVIVPCHRVIGADGTMTGFGGGIPTKEKLLELEGIVTAAAQMDLF